MIRTLFATTAIASLMTLNVIAQDTPAPAPAEPTVGQQVDNALDAAGNAMQNAGEAVQDAAGDAGQAIDNAAQNAEGVLHDTATDISNATRPVFDISAGYVVVDTDNLATRILGSAVYSSTADDAEQIGTVNDIVLTHDGQIAAVVLGVGGFLGIGEKSVAIDFRSLEFSIAADNTERWVLPTTAEALTASPDFVWQDDEPVMTEPAMTPVAPAPVVSQ